jgi:hypothetical protein
VVNTKVKTINIERVCGRELPPEWAKKAGVAPDDRVQVIIGPSREQAAEELCVTGRGAESLAEPREVQREISGSSD